MEHPAVAGPATPAPRPRDQRRRDTEHRLRSDVDLWLASASAEGEPYLVPLSFDWDGEALIVATTTRTPTAKNLTASRTTRIGLGLTRDVTLIDGTVEVLAMDELPPEQAESFAARAGFDPRVSRSSYRWFRIVPQRILAWREEDELPDRELMRDGRWLV